MARTWEQIIEARNAAKEKLATLTGESYESITKRMHDATSDCCGAYRHSAELGWVENELKKALAQMTVGNSFPGMIFTTLKAVDAARVAYNRDPAVKGYYASINHDGKVYRLSIRNEKHQHVYYW